MIKSVLFSQKPNQQHKNHKPNYLYEMRLSKKALCFAILFKCLAFVLSRGTVRSECFGYGKVCNSLSSDYPKSWGTDFRRFRYFCSNERSPKYSANIQGGWLEATKTVYSLYSLCHESYPRCRYQGRNCKCNKALKRYRILFKKV